MSGQEDSNQQDNGNKFSCAECGFSSRYKHNLTVHMRKHTGQRPYKCDKCKYSAAQGGNLATHLKTHSNERNFKCDTYLSPLGSKDYIEKDKLLPNSEIYILYQNFIPKEYKQVNVKSFISHLSIIDVIANIGKCETKNYIRN